MRAFDREANDLRLLRKVDKAISTNIENRIAAFLQSSSAMIVIADETNGKRYQVTIIDGEFVKREL